MGAELADRMIKMGDEVTSLRTKNEKLKMALMEIARSSNGPIRKMAHKALNA
jgi:hypothetical protein